MRNAEKVLEYMHNAVYVIIANRIFDSNLVAFFRSNFEGVGGGEGIISLSIACCCQREDIKDR